ncbi:hypothetical protein BX659_11056 [Orenia metallireducens]|uniref:hypothetical protein n=1 Tax=Orenia metallireducens TaxID=1413210 RepID=UPI000D06BC62|nr:hypothetical protein [Orenia metallireducens]PRX29312.1 hypothetical protein BX659_11056 [Orenia metallireducens]
MNLDLSFIKSAVKFSKKIFVLILSYILINIVNDWGDFLKYNNYKFEFILIGLFNIIIIIFFYPGMYYLIKEKLYGNLINIKVFLRGVKKYYKRLLLVSLVLGIIGTVIYFPIMLITYKNNQIVGEIFKAIFFTLFTYFTAFAAPIIILENYNSWDSIVYTFRYSIKEIRNNLQIFLIIILKYIITSLLTLISFNFAYSSYRYWVLSFIKDGVDSYFNILIFIIALLMLKENLIRTDSIADNKTPSFK